MKISSIGTLLLISGLLTISFSACTGVSNDSDRGPITLGDTATIVTETDSQYLGDVVLDLQEKDVIPANVPTAPKDTFRNVEAAKQLAAQQKQDSINAAKQAQTKEQPKEEVKKLSPAQERAQRKKDQLEEKKKKEEEAKKKQHRGKSGKKEVTKKNTKDRRR
ncbi:hypothetical protein DBR32_04975 [Taibaiella sp. KBW10]|uniref:hypothetical protein n=1 Tax=Taibaiella sp. KBW10 TaxID=2153357 RepID=UPI000F5B6952|nr:hypothetical protein [Taibaiella sp. KBW10]RQO31319.1 hypothetical protein DBR32_04975 [Taibaiella sp. KBW10]